MELKGQFTKPELFVLMDLMNASILKPEIAGIALPLELEDAIKLFKIDAKWNADGESLMAKLDNLSLFKLVAIEMWAYAFWYGPKNEKISADEYVEVLL